MGEAKRKRAAGYTPEPHDRLEMLIDIAEHHARRVLVHDRDPQLMPIFTLIAEDGHLIPVGTSWANDIEKRMAVELIRKMSRKHRCTHVSFLSEGWMQQVGPGEKFRLPIREQPDRVEVVMIYATDGIRTVSRMFRMVRDKPGGLLMDLALMPLGEGMSESELLDGIIEDPDERKAREAAA